MSFGFDPEQFFRRSRPRVVTPRGRPSKRSIIIAVIVVVLLALLFGAGSLMGLRVQYLFLSSLGHSNVFWTPLWSQIILFFVGFAITAILVGISVPFWSRSAKCIDQRLGRIVFWGGIVIAVLAGFIGGSYLASQWQDVLLFLHGQSFGMKDPVFQQDYGFFIFTLPVIDEFSALLWAGAIIGLLGAAALLIFSTVVINAPAEIDFPLKPAAGKTSRDALKTASIHTGAALAAIFVLAALGAHFGVYHLATTTHSPSFVGVDATQRAVTRPVLGALQIIALIFAVITILVVVWRRNAAGPTMGNTMLGLFVGWLVLAGALQGIPAAVYENTTVNPNAAIQQHDPINDFLTTSRYAWDLQTTGNNPGVKVCTVGEQTGCSFGPINSNPSVDDLSADPGTLNNVRIQDYRQLPDALAQIDRSRAYQTFSTITVDRYPDPSGNETEVMIGPREISETDIPNPTFVNKTFYYTHGYGITAVSVDQVGSEGKPYIFAGQQPLVKVAPDAPPDLYFHGNGDPRIYCGIDTTQPVVVNTNQPEFDYPNAQGDQTNSAGPGMAGFGLNNPFDKLAVSLTQMGGFDLFLTSYLRGDSEVMLHRAIADRVTTLAPFLTTDGDPYIVADPGSNHLVWILDAYIKTDRFPESFRQADGTSYMRNAVKAVVDARTCATTLYMVDPNEPLTASWNAIYPGLMKPLDQMPASLRAHLRYPEDYFQAQSQAYAQVHITDPNNFYSKNDLYQLSQELINNSGTSSQQTTQAYYVEMTLPGAQKPSFVLLQTFSPGLSGSQTQANNMTAWLAAVSDYTSGHHPQLVAVPMGNNVNVLGPLQFDNKINTDQTISSEITLLGQHGSQVVLGNVIILPFNNNSFLYVRPMYVLATSGSSGTNSFPQLERVIVGTQNAVADGPDFASALEKLFSVTSIPDLNAPATSSASPSPSQPAIPSTKGLILTSEEVSLINDLLQHEANAEAAYAKGDYATAGQEEQIVKQDAAQLRQLLAQNPPSTLSASPTASPTP